MWGYASRTSSTRNCFQRESRAFCLPPFGVSLHVTRRFLDCSVHKRTNSFLYRTPQRNRQVINCGIVVTLFFLTPLIATTFGCTKVAKMIRQHNASATATIQRRESGRERSRKWRKSKGITNHEIKLSKPLFAVVFALTICWIPFWIIVILRRFRLVAVMPRNVELFGMFLFYLSNAINPFIYAGMNPAFP